MNWLPTGLNGMLLLPAAGIAVNGTNRTTSFLSHSAGDLAVDTTVYTGATGNRFTLVPFINAQLSVAYCEEICSPGDPDLGIPPSRACFVNPNGTNVWNTGYPPDFTTWQKNKWKWTSAGLNTVLIQVFSVLYEAIAVGMNDWENHRTETQYQDQLILKNFVFQFVNNYFIRKSLPF